MTAGLVLLLATAAHAGQDEDASYSWTIGYERFSYYGQGPVLRRFLGDNWEIFISGGPNDWRSSEDQQSWEESYYEDQPTVLGSRDREDSDKRESGWVMLGAGRQVLRENRLWLTAVLGIEYFWNNYQNTDYSEQTREPTESRPYSLYIDQARWVGHTQELSLILGLRPAYDLTSRICVALFLGLEFSEEVGTEDYHWSDTYYDPDGVIVEMREGHERETTDSNDLETFGLTGTGSLSFFFRF